jgi:hypothetical protein
MPTTISIAELRRRVAVFADSIPDKASDLLADNKSAIVELVKAQMFHGLNGSNGGQIGHYKDPGYAEDKYELNSAAGFGVVDLRLTGRFYERLEARLTGSGAGAVLGITSTDEKSAQIEKKYKLIIYKLNGESKVIIRKNILQPGLVHKFLENVGGRIGYR